MKDYIPFLASKKIAKEIPKLNKGKLRDVLIDGLSGSDLTINIASMVSQLDKLLVVTDTEQAALKLHQEVDAILGDSPVNRVFFPHSDSIPLDKTKSSPNIISWQIASLYQIQNSKNPIIVTTSLKALYDCLITPDAIKSHCMMIGRGDILSLDALRVKLNELGYKQEYQVENIGEVAVRGGIIDFFSPSSQQPFRVEFDVDIIETIRLIDPQTQLSTQQVDSCMILPVSHLIMNKETVEDAQSLINMFLLTVKSDNDGLRDSLTHDIDMISSGVRFTGVEHYLPFFYGTTTRLLDYLGDSAVMWIDPDRLTDSYTRFKRDAMDVYVTGLKRGELLPQRELDDIERLEFPHITKQNPRIMVYPLRTPNPSSKTKRLGVQHPQPDPMVGRLQDMSDFISGKIKSDYRVIMATKQPTRIAELLSGHEFKKPKNLPINPEEEETFIEPFVDIVNITLEKGFEDRRQKILLLTDNELFGWRRKIGATRRFKGGKPIKSVDEIQPGDLLVHLTFGIGIYRGLKTVTAAGVTKEYLQVEYAKGDKLYIPPERLTLVHKYLGNAETVTINRLGGREWPEALAKVARGTKDIAAELLKLYAKRELTQGESYRGDNIWQQEMESAFPFEETEDQIRAISDVKRDLERQKPMDRLVCGDVGYGKTEIAIRAAFKVISSGNQVAMLVPTTILAMQHYSTFKERFAPFPIQVEQLSRFKGKTSQKKIIEGLADGTIEMVVGTHRLLSKDIEFKKLGLLIVDEEQRFGVEAKERIKNIKENVDVLTLTATPIPRTLEMTLTGIREVSQINSSPEGRKPVKTYVQPYNEKIVREAIETEIARGGQVYYVNNRIKGLGSILWKLERMLPKARLAVAHGQMGEEALEDVMIGFYQGDIDVLICTTIIESGLDIPSAGTLIVEDSQNLGLAQMYQLRGRVGRSERRAYAYFLYPNEKALTETARQRLEAIRDFVDLGAGMKVAMRDLEIRGAGNILGAAQSGHISAVGYDLYLRMLEDAKEKLKSKEEGRAPKPVNEDLECNVDLRISGFIPEQYVPDEALRIDCYQRMVGAKSTKEVEEIENELTDRFGRPPAEVESLFELVTIRVMGANMGITQIVEDNLTINFHFGPGAKLREDFLDRLLGRFGDRTTVRPNMIRIRKQRDNPIELSREFIKLACEE